MGRTGSPSGVDQVFLWERYEGFCDVLGCPHSDSCPLASSWGEMRWFVLLPSSPCPRSHWAASSSSPWSPQTAGRIPLERGPWRVLGRLGKELGIQQHLLFQTWDREEASRAHWDMELGGQQSCSIISGGSRMPFGSEHRRETALAGCLAELILVALLALLLISLFSSAHSPGLFMGCFFTPFLHGTLLGHAAGLFSASAGQGFVHVPTAGQW